MCSATTRKRALGRGFVAAMLGAAACLAVSACSPGAGADYPTLFPAVHDMPPPRADTTLSPVQVQQATEDLITERNHLSAEAQGSGAQGSGAQGSGGQGSGQKSSTGTAAPARSGAGQAAAAPAAAGGADQTAADAQ